MNKSEKLNTIQMVSEYIERISNSLTYANDSNSIIEKLECIKVNVDYLLNLAKTIKE